MGGVAKNIEGGGGMQERDKEDKMRGMRKKIEGGGMPERVKKTKCGGGGVAKKN